jgi:dihydrofolate reductase
MRIYAQQRGQLAGQLAGDVAVLVWTMVWAVVGFVVDGAVAALDAAGYARVYLDGGSTVRQLLARGRVQTLTLARVPVLIGEGFSLFGPLPADVDLEHVGTEVLGGGMVQTTYRVRESSPGATP